MATLDWQLRQAGDATLVELLVTSDAEVRVEIESNLRPVWPPRRRNKPAAGWSESGFEGTVAAGEPLVLGYASPDDPVEPPATIVETEPVSETPEEPPTPEGLVRALGEARPPRDAVPSPDDPPLDGSHSGESVPAEQSPATDRVSPAEEPSPSSSGQPSSNGQPPTSGPSSSSGQSSPDSQASTSGQHPGGAPSGVDDPGVEAGESVDAWLAAVEHRIEMAERLAAVETAEEGRAAVESAGGIEQVRTLCERLDADRERLERIENRRTAFDQRLAGVEVPLSALERLA